MTTATAQLCGHPWLGSAPCLRDWPGTPHRRATLHHSHRCDEPADHPPPCTCRCGATTTRRDAR